MAALMGASRPAASLPNSVRTAIRWVSPAISWCTSIRAPSRQPAASAAAHSTIVPAYERTWRGRTAGWTRARLRRQSSPVATTTPSPSNWWKAQPSSIGLKVDSTAPSSSAACSGRETRTLRCGPSAHGTQSP